MFDFQKIKKIFKRKDDNPVILKLNNPIDESMPAIWNKQKIEKISSNYDSSPPISEKTKYTIRSSDAYNKAKEYIILRKKVPKEIKSIAQDNITSNISTIKASLKHERELFQTVKPSNKDYIDICRNISRMEKIENELFEMLFFLENGKPDLIFEYKGSFILRKITEDIIKDNELKKRIKKKYIKHILKGYSKQLKKYKDDGENKQLDLEKDISWLINSCIKAKQVPEFRPFKRIFGMFDLKYLREIYHHFIINKLLDKAYFRGGADNIRNVTNAIKQFKKRDKDFNTNWIMLEQRLVEALLEFGGKVESSRCSEQSDENSRITIEYGEKVIDYGIEHLIILWRLKNDSSGIARLCTEPFSLNTYRGAEFPYISQKALDFLLDNFDNDEIIARYAVLLIESNKIGKVIRELLYTNLDYYLNPKRGFFARIFRFFSETRIGTKIRTKGKGRISKLLQKYSAENRIFTLTKLAERIASEQSLSRDKIEILKKILYKFYAKNHYDFVSLIISRINNKDLYEEILNELLIEYDKIYYRKGLFSTVSKRLFIGKMVYREANLYDAILKGINDNIKFRLSRGAYYVVSLMEKPPRLKRVPFQLDKDFLSRIEELNPKQNIGKIKKKKVSKYTVEEKRRRLREYIERGKHQSELEELSYHMLMNYEIRVFFQVINDAKKLDEHLGTIELNVDSFDPNYVLNHILFDVFDINDDEEAFNVTPGSKHPFKYPVDNVIFEYLEDSLIKTIIFSKDEKLRLICIDTLYKRTTNTGNPPDLVKIYRTIDTILKKYNLEPYLELNGAVKEGHKKYMEKLEYICTKLEDAYLIKRVYAINKLKQLLLDWIDTFVITYYNYRDLLLERKLKLFEILFTIVKNDFETENPKFTFKQQCKLLWKGELWDGKLRPEKLIDKYEEILFDPLISKLSQSNVFDRESIDMILQFLEDLIDIYDQRYLPGQTPSIDSCIGPPDKLKYIKQFHFNKLIAKVCISAVGENRTLFNQLLNRKIYQND